MANKLNLDAKKGLYEIEVNDKGDVITFDPEDVELPFKMNEAYLKIQNIVDKIDNEEQNIVDDDQKHGFVKASDEKRRCLIKELYSEMRAAADTFLGDGAMQKIFGDRNYPDMYNDLFKALEPHFVAMGLTPQKSIKTIEEKYNDSDDDVLE